jgi:hypothetical protein
MKEDVSQFSIGLSVAALLLAGVLILGVLAAVLLLLNPETLPQSPIIMGPAR